MALYINCLDSADESLATSIKSALVDRLLKDFRPDFGRVVALLLDKDASEHVYYALAAFVEITQAAAMEPVLVPDQAFEYLLEEGNPKPTTPAAITAIEQLSHHTHKVTVFLSLAERAFLHAIHDAQQVIFSISRRSSSQMGLVLAIVAVAILKRALSFFVSSCIIDTNMEECGEIMLKDEDHIEYCQTCAPTP